MAGVDLVLLVNFGGPPKTSLKIGFSSATNGDGDGDDDGGGRLLKSPPSDFIGADFPWGLNPKSLANIPKSSI